MPAKAVLFKGEEMSTMTQKPRGINRGRPLDPLSTEGRPIDEEPAAQLPTETEPANLDTAADVEEKPKETKPQDRTLAEVRAEIRNKFPDLNTASMLAQMQRGLANYPDYVQKGQLDVALNVEVTPDLVDLLQYVTKLLWPSHR